MDIENFLKLLRDFSVSVNKTEKIEEIILQAQRYKLKYLPLLGDVKLVHNFLYFLY